MNLLYIEASAGLSGDMLLAGLLDLGLPLRILHPPLRALGLSKVRVKVRWTRREGCSVGQATVDHRSAGPRCPRQALHLMQWVKDSQLPKPIRSSVLRALLLLTKAEGKAHRVDLRHVTLHQLASADTLVALIGFCLGLRYFKISKVFTSLIPLGQGHLDPHGIWRSRPGPATQRLLRGFPTFFRQERFEWTTPTGAVLVSASCSPKPPPAFRVTRIGYGAGHLLHQGPSLLRLFLGRPV